MRTGSLTAVAFLGLSSIAPGQRFGFTRQMLPAANDNTTALALGDVDGDGDLDALLGNLTVPPAFAVNRLYLNDGTGAFADATATNLSVSPDLTQAMTLGDVDGDGDLDALVGNLGQVRLYQNGGTGILTEVTATNLPTLFGDVHAVALGDVDGDGDLDAFASDSGSGQDRLLLNGGSGIYTDATATNLPALPGDTRSVALGDVDADGDLDAFVGRSGPFPAGGQNRLLLNGGGGILTDATATNLPILTGDTRSVALGDVDADGDLDAFVGNFYDPNRLYRNGGGGTFVVAPAAGLPPSDGYTRSVGLGDVDGDGDLDALLGKPGSEELLLNGGAGNFTNATVPSLSSFPNDTYAIALGDVDGDGDLDAIDGIGGQDRLLLNDGTGAFSEVTAANSRDLGGSLTLGDVDGDGDLDALVAGVSTPSRLFLNGGTGIFADATSTNLPPGFNLASRIALGDVDGDGDLDAFLAAAGADRLLVNGGAGVFTDATATNLPVLTGTGQDVALGDVDGDGDLDAFVGNLSQTQLLVNGGIGVFTDATATNVPLDPLALTSAVALGDVDGDGDLDAYLGTWGWPSVGGQDRLYLNGGTGIFTDATATNLPAILENTRDVALGDVDGDGDLDAFVGSGIAGAPAQSRLYLNGGLGIFTDATGTNLPALVDPTEKVGLGDFDEDGDLDALLGNLGQSRLLVNAGLGVFTDATANDLPALFEGAVTVALGDIDGDGDLDAFLGRPYANLSRQLSWRGIPRAGKPLNLDVRGPANGTWLLGASATSGSLPLPPFGTLRLGLSTLFVVGGGVLDPQGRATVSFLVPPNPVLLGASLYWQAVVGAPLRFTNLEVTTVTNL